MRDVAYIYGSGHEQRCGRPRLLALEETEQKLNKLETYLGILI